MSGWERHLARIVNGTFQLGSRRWHWLWETREGRTIIRRCTGTAVLGWAVYRLGGQWPWLWGITVLLVLVMAYRGADDQDEQPELEADAEDERLELTEAEETQLIVDAVRHLAGDRNGVHLEVLRANWAADGLDMDLSEFRRWVEAHGVIVRDSLKVRGTNLIGIHLNDLPATAAAPAAAAPPPAVPDDLLQDW